MGHKIIPTMGVTPIIFYFLDPTMGVVSRPEVDYGGMVMKFFHDYGGFFFGKFFFGAEGAAL